MTQSRSGNRGHRARSGARPRRPKGRSLVGERYDVRPERVGHGGFVVARHEGVVVFVRHALPGERVVVEVTEGQEGDRFLRADAVEVLEASPDRVVPPCPFSGPGRCGGCDFQHVALPAQRGLKADVVREQLARLAKLDVDVTVEPLPDPTDRPGLDWRTRMQWALTRDGAPGLRQHRSHDVVAVDHCRIAHPALPDLAETRWPDATSLETMVSAAGETLTLVETRDGRAFADGPTSLHEHAAGRDFEVTASGFWQVHPAAADTLVGAVLAALDPQPGERALDLYSGVGLFTAAIADVVGPTGYVLGVEADEVATEDAAANLADLPHATATASTVDRFLLGEESGSIGAVDLVVLDPPRTGAKRDVVSGITALEPRAVAYVACDPAALARDVAFFAEDGYALTSLRAFDLFPMTHHVECVALLTKSGSDLG